MLLIGIGANLHAPDGASPLLACQRAATELDALPGLQLRALSRWYLTEPVPPSGQPPYVNGVAVLEVMPGMKKPAPAELLAMLQGIEARAGRVRAEPNGPRTLDLDIIAMGQTVRAAPDPVLPHPRAHLRAFVLVPLLDVAPGWVHPTLGRAASELLRELPQQTVQAI